MTPRTSKKIPEPRRALSQNTAYKRASRLTNTRHLLEPHHNNHNYRLAATAYSFTLNHADLRKDTHGQDYHPRGGEL